MGIGPYLLYRWGGYSRDDGIPSVSCLSLAWVHWRSMAAAASYETLGVGPTSSCYMMFLSFWHLFLHTVSALLPAIHSNVCVLHGMSSYSRYYGATEGFHLRYQGRLNHDVVTRWRDMPMPGFPYPGAPDQGQVEAWGHGGAFARSLARMGLCIPRCATVPATASRQTETPAGVAPWPSTQGECCRLRCLAFISGRAR